MPSQLSLRRAFSQYQKGIKMIFKKQAIQGGAVLSNGERIDFNAAGYYETGDQVIIDQLSPIYEVVAEKEEETESAPAKAPSAAIATAKAGMASSASIAANTK